MMTPSSRFLDQAGDSSPIVLADPIASGNLLNGGALDFPEVVRYTLESPDTKFTPFLSSRRLVL